MVSEKLINCENSLGAQLEIATSQLLITTPHLRYGDVVTAHVHTSSLL